MSDDFEKNIQPDSSPNPDSPPPDRADPENSDSALRRAERKKIFRLVFGYLNREKIITPPVAAIILIGIISLIIWRISVFFEPAAEFFARSLSYALRAALTAATRNIPFSLAELILICAAPLILFAAFRVAAKLLKSPGRRIALSMKYLLRIIALLSFCVFIFTFTFGVCYNRTPVNQLMGIPRRPVSPEQLKESVRILLETANHDAQNVTLRDSATGSTVLPFSMAELNQKLNAAYDALLTDYPFVKKIYSTVKPVMLSEWLSRIHTTGIYIPFTGEANINVGFPDYVIPFTAAHEMAHLMGIAREDEANFVAFLVCMHSDDPYIRYSGAVNMLDYMASPLYTADPDAYNEYFGALNQTIKIERAAYSAFFEKYRHSAAAKVSSKIYDGYLKSQGQQQGAKSYNLVVDLAVAYLSESEN